MCHRVQDFHHYPRCPWILYTGSATTVGTQVGESQSRADKNSLSPSQWRPWVPQNPNLVFNPTRVRISPNQRVRIIWVSLTSCKRNTLLAVGVICSPGHPPAKRPSHQAPRFTSQAQVTELLPESKSAWG